MVVLRRAQHLHQVAGLAIVTQHFRADQKANLATGKFADQPLDSFHRWIVRLTNAEDNFILWIILNAVAAEAFIHLRINAAQRLKNAHRRGKGGRLAVVRLKKRPGAPQAEQVKAHAAHSQPSRYQSWKKIQHCRSRSTRILNCSVP